jgi:uncharacterized protein YoxC
MALGSKIFHKANKLGNKVTNKIDTLGRKTQNTLNKVEKNVANIDRRVENTVNRGADIAQDVIRKSGKVTDALRVGANITNSVAQNLAGTGIPGTQALATASGALSKGANKLDRLRDDASRKIENSRDKIILEKDNLRKKIDRKNEDLRNEVSNVFV